MQIFLKQHTHNDIRHLACWPLGVYFNTSDLTLFPLKQRPSKQFFCFSYFKEFHMFWWRKHGLVHTFSFFSVRLEVLFLHLLCFVFYRLCHSRGYRRTGGEFRQHLRGQHGKHVIIVLSNIWLHVWGSGSECRCEYGSFLCFRTSPWHSTWGTTGKMSVWLFPQETTWAERSTPGWWRRSGCLMSFLSIQSARSFTTPPWRTSCWGFTQTATFFIASGDLLCLETFSWQRMGKKTL